MTATMETMRLGGTGIDTTILAFGCADLFREPSRAGRRRLLDAAFAAGIRHFDVAPMYGLGLAEADLGGFVRHKRDQIVIATKFGIEPTPVARLIGRVQGPVRRSARILTASGGRPRAQGVDPRSGRIGRLLYGGGQYDPATAHASLNRSLRAFQTDYLDLLFLHDPMHGARTSDVREYLERARAAGRIRAWGIAGEAESAIDAARSVGVPVPVLQIRGDVISRTVCPSPAGSADAVILFGVIGRVSNLIAAHVGADRAVRRRWSDAVGIDCGSTEAVVDLLLADALRSNAGGVVLFSTTRVERIERAAAVARGWRACLPGVDALRALVTTELVGAESRA